MEFIESLIFTKESRYLLTEDGLRQLQMVLSSQPEIGRIIIGSKGLRKVRWFCSGKGKRGGLRIIYYWLRDDYQIVLLHVYEKSKQEDLTIGQIKFLRKLIED